MGTTFTVDASTTNTLVTHAYNAPGAFRVGVKYMDNDGQWSQPYPFTITIREVRRVFYVKDHLGNIRQSINESGTVVAAQDYYPYGEFISGRSYNSGHPLEKYRFTEKERDIETGFDNFGGRLYDGALGVWLQVDPLTDKYPGVSSYNYVMNNPLKFIDPTGMEIHIFIYNNSKQKIDLDKVAGIVKQQYEDAGVKDVNVYTGFVGKLEYDFGKTFLGNENNFQVQISDINLGNENGAKAGVATKNPETVIVSADVISKAVNNLETGVANVASHEVGHKNGLKHPGQDEHKDHDDGSIMGTRIKKGGLNMIRPFNESDKKKLRERLNKEEEDVK